MLQDIKWAAKMIRATVRDEDGHALNFWEKLWVVAQVILGIITIEHEVKR